MKELCGTGLTPIHQINTHLEKEKKTKKELECRSLQQVKLYLLDRKIPPIQLTKMEGWASQPRVSQQLSLQKQPKLRNVNYAAKQITYNSFSAHCNIISFRLNRELGRGQFHLLAAASRSGLYLQHVSFPVSHIKMKTSYGLSTLLYAIQAGIYTGYIGQNASIYGSPNSNFSSTKRACPEYRLLQNIKTFGQGTYY